MAARATGGAGNWSSTTINAPWTTGVVPAAGDTVTISHAVTYDINDDTNGIGDITIATGGTLQWAGGAGTKALRCAGNITLNGGQIIGRDGTFIRFATASKGLTINNVAGSNLDFKGSLANPETYLTADAAVGDGVLAVNSASDFAPGDIISIYRYTELAYNDRTDEGFYVQAISGNNIYVRRRVGPELILAHDIAIGDNAFYCTGDVRAWRPSYKFIIDSEVFTVNAIDSVNQIIYTTANAVAEHLSGATGYTTGVEKAHLTNDKVYKLAPIIKDATTGNTYVDVSSAAGWATGDEIAISGGSYSNCEKRTIASIGIGSGTDGGDRINFTGALLATHDIGSPVVKINRDCVIHGNATDTIANNCGFIYQLAGSTARTFRFENSEMRYYGGTTTTNWGINLQGSGSTNLYLILNSCGRHTYKSSNSGAIGQYSGGAFATMRNNVSYDTNGSMYAYSTTYNLMTNNIAVAVNNTSFYYSSSDKTVMSYNIAEGCGYGLYLSSVGGYSGAYNGVPYVQLRHNIMNRCICSIYRSSWSALINGGIEYTKSTNPTNRHFYSEWTCEGGARISNIMLSPTVSSAQEASDYLRGDAYGILSQITYLDNVDFIPGKRIIRYIWGYAESDESLVKRGNYSWKFTPKSSSAAVMIGFYAWVWGIKGRTIKIGAWVRKNAALNGTRPSIDLRDRSYVNVAYTIMSTANDTWEYITCSYTMPDDDWILVRVAANGTAGNFWIDAPTIDASGCHYRSGILEPEWLSGNPTPTGVRLTGVRF